MKKLIPALIVVIIIVLILVQNQESRKTPTSKAITIGAVVSLTGYAAVDGMNIKNGMDLAIADLKAEGVDVVIKYEDDNTDPKQSVSAVHKLVSTEKLDAMVGPIWSFLIDAALPVINQNKLVTFVPSASSEVVDGASPYIFYGTYKNIEEAQPLANFLKEKNIKNVAVIVSNDTWGESQVKGFTSAVDMAGGQIILLEKISFGSDKDVMPTIVAKINKLNPDAVLWTGYDEAGTILIKKMQEQNFNKPIIAAASIMKGLVKRGVVNPRPTDQLYTINIPMDSGFRAKYIATYNQEPGVSADSAYDGVKILVQGIRLGKTGDELAKYLSDNVNYKGYLGTYNFDKSGDIVGGNWVVEKLTTPH